MTSETPVSIRIVLNGRARDVSESATIADLVRALELSPEQVAVEQNGRLVRKLDHATRCVAAGDVIEIVTLVGGG